MLPKTSFLTQCSTEACTNFEACPAGWSSGTQPEPLRSCKQCDAGQTSSAASTVCRDCTKGKFGVIDSSGAGVCDSCLPGLFQPEETSATSCSRCPFGWTQENKGESSCKDLGGTKPEDCKDDEYFNSTLRDCERCPLGSSCLGPINFTQVKAKFGWQQCSNNLKKFTQCSFPGACLGGPNPALYDKFFDAQKNDLAQCSNCTERCNDEYGYANGSRLCGQCASGYSLDGLSGICKEW